MTIYDKELETIVAERCAAMTPVEVLATLREINLLDHTRCKAFLVKELVQTLVDGGMRRTVAVETAAKRLCCSYECARKYIYTVYK